jgi:hypothetical protein
MSSSTKKLTRMEKAYARNTRFNRKEKKDRERGMVLKKEDFPPINGEEDVWPRNCNSIQVVWPKPIDNSVTELVEEILEEVHAILVARKKPDNRKSIPAELLVDVQQSYADGGRPTIAEAIEYKKLHPNKSDQRLPGRVYVHKARRQCHGILLESIGSVSEILIESMKLSADDKITVQCLKDRGDKKECTHHLNLDPFIQTLLWHSMEESDEEYRNDCSSLKNRLEGAAMSLRLEDCRKNRHARGFARIGICPRIGCLMGEGFVIDPSYITESSIISCPLESCITNDEPTWWCSMCDTSHFSGTLCPPDDPRVKMTLEQLEQHQRAVDNGEEQWCRCGTPYAKDDGCPSVRCDIESCKFHFCFACGGELTDNYMDHIINKPDDNGIGKWVCCKTVVKKALNNEDSMREFIRATMSNLSRATMSCDNLRRAITEVMQDDNIQITEEQRGWINSVLACNT